MVTPRFDFNDDHFIQAGFELIFGSSFFPMLLSDNAFCQNLSDVMTVLSAGKGGTSPFKVALP